MSEHNGYCKCADCVERYGDFGPDHDALCRRGEEIRAMRTDSASDLERERWIADILRLDGKDQPAELRKRHPVYLRDLCAGAYDRAAARIANEELDRRFQARLDAEQSHAEMRIQLHALRMRGPERLERKRADTERSSYEQMIRNLEHPEH